MVPAGDMDLHTQFERRRFCFCRYMSTRRYTDLHTRWNRRSNWLRGTARSEGGKTWIAGCFRSCRRVWAPMRLLSAHWIRVGEGETTGPRVCNTRKEDSVRRVCISLVHGRNISALCRRFCISMAVAGSWHCHSRLQSTPMRYSDNCSFAD